jgi:hypothetical protein
MTVPGVRREVEAADDDSGAGHDRQESIFD